jgi:uncharacterized membrane protein YkvA (DUF1232 family)
MTAENAIRHQTLLERVSERLAATSTATDQLLLTRWRVLGLCQFLVGGGAGQAEDLTIRALDDFARKGAGGSTDASLKRAGSAVAQTVSLRADSVLPRITPDKQDEVRTQLEHYEALGPFGIEKAVGLLPSLRSKLQGSPMGALLAGIRHRLELVAALVADTERPTAQRQRASAAILYLDELHDVIPDTLGHIGLLDDDFALRLVLEEIGEYTENERLHWAERISVLWDDLPFLQGVRLSRDEDPVDTMWLDRINSYVSYTHALNGAEKPLILVQPSVACSLLHSIISLIGLLVLDGLTSSQELLKSLKIGQIYEIDRQFFARYEGPFVGPPVPGWLRLRFRDDIIISQPPTMADRMVATTERRLSSGKAFSYQKAKMDAEPIQKFFDWGEAIGAASLTSRILLVTSRQRAIEILGDIRSNGISLLESGLLKFAGTDPSPDLIRSGLVLVVPTLAVARKVVDQGLAAHAIVVDGYERLYRGRHDLPFLLMPPSPPPVIVWSATGYYPEEPPSWLPQHRRLQIAPDDLSYILEMDGDLADTTPSRASLWEAATASGAEKVHVPWTLEEQELLVAIDELITIVRSFTQIPDYWKYHIFSSSTTLRTLAIATPAFWSDIRDFTKTWQAAFREQWGELRRGAAEQLEPVARAHKAVLAAVDRPNAEMNSKALALTRFLETSGTETWSLVCDRPEQVKIAGRLMKRAAVQGVEPVLLRDLGVCKACIVVGWRSYSFGRRLAAHTPQRLVALVDHNEAKRWDRLQTQSGAFSKGDSLLDMIGHVRPRTATPPEPIGREPDEDDPDWLEEAGTDETDQRRVPCACIWLSNERQGKLLARDARVLVEVGDQAREKPAHRIAPEDRVILGAGSGKWSPADEFTQSVVEVMSSSHPELVNDVREWRRALKQCQEDRGWTTEQVRDQLAKVGVDRRLQTIDRWLRIDQVAPIGPMHLRKELEAMWLLIEGYTERTAEDVVAACGRLRSLRFAAGRALLKLWKGRSVDIGVDDAWLGELVEQLRQEVQVHEVDAVTFGAVPEAMLGWWVTPGLADKYGLDLSQDATSETASEYEDEDI